MRAQRWLLLVLVLGVLTTTAASRAANRRMFPNLTIFRGGGLKEPVALQHCCLRTVTVNGRSGSDISGDTLAMIYQELSPAIAAQVDPSDTTSFTEVAEFFGSSPLPLDVNTMMSTLRRTDLPRLFGQATHYSRIYRRTANQSPIWENPVVAPGGANAQFYVIDPAAEKILASIGVRMK